MKKHLLGFLFTCFYGLSIAQDDRIITWSGDTIAVFMPGEPWKEGFRPASRYENGYVRTLALFANDSVRLIEAGEVKGYYRKDHGKRFLCDGYFEARKVDAGKDLQLINWWRTGTGGKQDADNPWYFMSPVIKNKHVSLYRIYRWCGECMHPVYFISRPEYGDPLLSKPVWTNKETMKLLNDPDVAAEMKDYWKNAKRKRIWKIVEHFNKVKEQAAIKNGSPD